VESVFADLETLVRDDLVLAAKALKGGLGLVILLTEQLSLMHHKAGPAKGLAALGAGQTLWVVVLSKSLNQLNGDWVAADRTEHVVEGHVVRLTVRLGAINHVKRFRGKIGVAHGADKTVLVVHLLPSIHAIIIVN
jgi:hypothetical protein